MILVLAPNLEEEGGIQEYGRKLLYSLKLSGILNSVLELKSTSIWSKLSFTSSFIYKCIFLKPDLIIAVHIGFAPLCYWAKRLLKIKYFISAHGIEVWDLGKEKKYLYAADLILAVSNFTRNKMLDQLPDIGSRIKILPNCVDENEFYIKKENLKTKYGFDENDKIIFTLTRLSALEKYKGYDRVLELMPEILKEVPSAKYLIGGRGDDMPRLQGMIKNLGLEGSIMLLGRIPKEKLVDYYNLADVFVMPSKGEGFGIVFLEAMACGTPVIGGNKDGSVDALASGELGTLIDPDDKESIIEAILKTLKNSTLADPDKLRVGVLNKFGFGKFHQNLSNILKNG